MRISDWSSDVCSSDLLQCIVTLSANPPFCDRRMVSLGPITLGCTQMVRAERPRSGSKPPKIDPAIQIEVEAAIRIDVAVNQRCEAARSEEHTSELQSLMRISYAVFCLKKKTQHKNNKTHK